MNDEIRNLRKEYTVARLEGVDPDPFRQFDRWLQEALAAEVPEPHGMTLCTVNPAGQPSSRVVLLREATPQGLVFFTNYLSRKGQDLEGQPLACVSFWWPQLERQVRIEGRVEKIDPTDSDAYFASRPRESQLSAASSPQSQPIPSREVLEAKVQELDQQFPEQVPRPAHWGGYRLVPHHFEFWQGGAARLHDRFVLDRKDSGWRTERLAP